MKFRSVIGCRCRIGSLRLAFALASAVGAGNATAQKPQHTETLAATEVRAQLVPVHAATLSSEMAGRIDAISTRIGDRFRKGDVLVSFDCALPNAQLTHAQAALTEAARTYEIDRRAAAQNTTGQLELDIPAAEVLKAKSDLAAAETLVSKCTIAAPFAGVTADQKMRAFEYATPGQPILEVLDDSTIQVELTATAHSLGWLKPGAPFQLRVDATGKTYPGRVVRRGARAEPGSQLVKATGEIVGDAADLLPGMSGHAVPAPR
jgi:membrane fusion protein, multidrug efflux system